MHRYSRGREEIPGGFLIKDYLKNHGVSIAGLSANRQVHRTAPTSRDTSQLKGCVIVAGGSFESCDLEPAATIWQLGK